MKRIDRLFSLMYRRYFFGATFYSVLRRTHLYGLFSYVLGKLDTKLHRYDELPRFNIAVCANMSAGKSTLVNALLGKDLLPVRNDAATAKITSVYDRDGMRMVFGCCVSKNDVATVSCCADVNGIGNGTRVVVVHDTPGTNASWYPAHRDVTLGFLGRESPDAILYVVNFENMMSDDQEVLLHDIYSLQGAKRKIPVIFAVNKLDSADLTKDDTTGNLREFDKHVRAVGYSNYVIVPVAARGGRLLKMALLGRGGDFTEKESDDFESVFRGFYKRMDVRAFWHPNATHQNAFNTYGCRAAKILVAGVEYPVEQLAIALDNTGIPGLEALLENLNY